MDVELKQQFEEMGIEPDKKFLEKAEELCLSYNIDNYTEFVEKYLAFTISKMVCY